MSKLIPPLLSTTPPPIGPADVDEHEDDEFGDFAAAVEDTTYGCDSFSIPNTPEDSPRKTPHLQPPLVTDDEPAGVKPPDTPVILQEAQQTKDYQDKRKNVDCLDQLNGVVPHVPSLPNFNDAITNGHDHQEAKETPNIERSLPPSCGGKHDEDDDAERPPQLFDDASEEKDEVSETPSNFSISFDDNVIDDDDEEDVSDHMPIELPNHLQDIEIDEKIETLRNIQEFDEFDNDIKLNNEESLKNEASKDDFGDFNTFASIPSISTKTEETFNNLQVSCDIQSNSNESINSVHNNTGNLQKTPLQSLENEENPKIEEIEDDFDDFQYSNHTKTIDTTINTSQIVQDDDFDDFADFSSAPIDVAPETSRKIEEHPVVERRISLEDDVDDGDDDFGDFDDYTTSTSSATTAPSMMSVPLLTQEKVYEETQLIFKVMFESIASEDGEYEYGDATLNSAIFEQIKNVTDAHALSYQWGKSHVQKGLLKALNIDMRNMLHGHGMPMPKFAANLGMQPLEPVKSDILAPTPAPPLITSAQAPPTVAPPTGDIPAAQFDWHASGLANPLDSNQASTLFDLGQLAATLSLPTTSSTTTCAVDVDRNRGSEKSGLDEDWDLWLQSVSKEDPKPSINTRPEEVKPEENNTLTKPPTYDTESVNSLQFPEVTDAEESKVEPQEAGDDFSDFTSFQYTSNTTSVPQQPSSTDTTLPWTSTSNMIPLRETYIDDVKADWSYEKIDQPERVSEVILEDMSKKVDFDEGDDEDDFDDFQDFQTSSQVSVNQEIPSGEPTFRNVLSPTVLQPTLLEPVKLSSPLVEPQVTPQAILWPDPGITDEELARFDLYVKKVEPVVTTVESVPKNTIKPQETKLSGPGGALMVEKHVVVPASKVILPFNEVLLPPNNQVVISKDLVLPILESSPRKYSPQQKTTPICNSVVHVQQMAPLASQPDEEDWCDFVSTQPVMTTSTSGVTQTGSNVSPSKLSSTPNINSTPQPSTQELSLSIPQLRSMQSMQPPPQPPIPVITPRGLVQTKIPTLAPSTPIKSLPQTALHVQPPNDGYQPAIISTQFAAHVNHLPSTLTGYLHNGHHYQTTNIPVNSQSHAIPNGRHAHSHTQVMPTAASKHGLHDDDEWSDFMSSQPVNTGNHSLYTPPVGVATLQPTYGNLATVEQFMGGVNPPLHQQQQQQRDWSRVGYVNDLPNIITNPVHFQSYPMNTPNLSKKTPSNGILHNKNKKPQNLNVARLPDLEFVAPKTKLYQNNKK